MMGIKFPENFNFPYAASSFREFWKRWHISLSSWIRDYLYLPIMKTKVVSDGGTGIGNVLNDNQPKRNKNIALFLTWSIMGLWHGANWTFIFWGVYHASFVFIERIINKFRKKRDTKGNIKSILNWALVIPIAMLSWIPFRAANMGIVFKMYGKLFSLKEYKYFGMKENIYIVCAILFLLTTLMYLYKTFFVPRIQKTPSISFVLNVSAYTLMIILVFTFLRPISQFIYFQF